MKRDIVSQLETQLSLQSNITTNTTTTGNSTDNADFEEGLMYSCLITTYTDGDYTLGIEESDDDGATDPWTAVPAEKLIAGGTESADTVGAWGKIGAFSTKRYTRPTILSENVTTGALVTCIVTRKSEYQPI